MNTEEIQFREETIGEGLTRVELEVNTPDFLKGKSLPEWGFWFLYGKIAVQEEVEEIVNSTMEAANNLSDAVASRNRHTRIAKICIGVVGLLAGYMLNGLF